MAENEFIHGNSRDLKDMVKADEYVYVGDHFVGDMWSSSQCGWTDALVVIDLALEKGITGIITRYEEVDNNEVNNGDYAEQWGSLFKHRGSRTYWWDFAVKHSTTIAGSIEEIVKNLL